jgi:uncharacterized damage-inducible protein DinB
MQMKRFRNNGAIGALLDEYEKAVQELKEVIDSFSTEELKQIVDKTTEDPDCVSIQSILNHVIRAGYNYVVAIRNNLGEQIKYRSTETFGTINHYQSELTKMFEYNVELFSDYPNIKLEEYDNDKKINVRWGQQYDVEQLFEHAIVHVLRHRRQIERFYIKIKEKKS